MTATLPEGWATIRVGDYFHSWGGMTPSTSNASYWGGNVPWVSSRDVKAWRIAGGGEFITKKALEDTRLCLCPIGSVLVVVRSGILAHTLPIAVVDAPVSINQDLKAFHCPDRNLNEWLALALRALAPEILTNNRKDGTTVQSVRYEELCDLIISVPPSNEQERISARLGELLERVRDARERVSRVPAILRYFRQALLAAACSGRLTEDWREANRRSLEEDWYDAELSDICASISDGDHQPPPKQDSGIPFLTIRNISSRHLDFAETRYVSEEYFDKIKPERKPRRGDVLYSVVATIGIPVIVDVDRPFCFQRHIALLRASNQTTPEFLWVLMSSPGVFREGWSRVTGTAQPTLPLGNLRTIPIKVPSLEEQGEIVRRIQLLIQLADTIEGRVRVASCRADKLVQSILARAFRGELVPTEAELARREGRDYEPASMLLERIKRQRESDTSSKPERKRTRTKGVGLPRALNSTVKR